MALALSYLIESGVQALFMMAALWVMIKIQSLNYTFLGLVICGALASAIDVIPNIGHYLAVPTLYVCVARMTRADVFPDAIFTVVVAYALTFCMNLFVLKTLVVSVVSTERLILWRSEIFGGISNEISVLLDESTLPRDMKGIPFGRGSQLRCFQIFVLQRKATWKRERRILWPS